MQKYVLVQFNHRLYHLSFVLALNRFFMSFLRDLREYKPMLLFKNTNVFSKGIIAVGLPYFNWP